MKTTGLIAGCFDPFPHPGQVLAIQQALQNGCDEVVVALHVNPGHKGGVYCSVEERTIMVRAIRGVSLVIPYETEDDLITLLEVVKPNVRILGEDYKDKSYTGDYLKIPVFYAKRFAGWSGTEFRNRIANGIVWRPDTLQDVAVPLP